jgi:hypothetical protein
MLIFGFDPGFSGAWGAITHNGNYHSCGDMHHTDKHLLTQVIWSEICLARDGQDCEVVVEAVHAMPGQGVSSTFKFGVSFGGVLSLAERFNCPWHTVAPRTWKNALQLDSDKDKSLLMARELWPDAPLARKKDNGRAEALLLAEYWRRQIA